MCLLVGKNQEYILRKNLDKAQHRYSIPASWVTSSADSSLAAFVALVAMAEVDLVAKAWVVC